MAKVEHDIVDQASLLWRMIYAVLLEYRRAHPDWIVVRHEDLALDPVGGFANLYRRLGLGYSEDIRRRVRWYSSGSPELEADAGAYAIRRASEQAIQGWRQRLSAEEQSRLRAQVEPLASQFYADSEW